MVDHTPSPAGLDELPPGPELAAALARVDRSTCNGFQLIELVQARYRQIGWEQAQLFGDIHELAHTPYGAPQSPPTRQSAADPHTTMEVSFALGITHRAAEDQMATAWQLLDVYPAVHAALADGRIDVSKAMMLLREVEAADPDQARPVLAQVLPTAAHRSYAALRDTVRRLLLTLDPDLVRRRHAASILRRNVTHTEHPDGTASITGRFLPKNTVAAVFDHLNRLTGAIKKASRQPGAPIPADTRTADPPTNATSTTPDAGPTAAPPTKTTSPSYADDTTAPKTTTGTGSTAPRTGSSGSPPNGRAYPVPLGREFSHEQRRLLQHLITEGERQRTPMRT